MSTGGAHEKERTEMRIEDYGLIGDLRTAALVGRDGSVDWLCLPRFDSDACFAALLGDQRHGRWLIAPAGGVRRVTRRYRPATLVLETELETEHGAVRLVDCMPRGGGAESLVRVVEDVRGSVPMRTELVLRLDYGSTVPWVTGDLGGLSAIAGPDTLRLWAPVELRGEGPTTVARFTIREGERVPFVLDWHPSHLPALDALARTQRFWEEWSARCSYQGGWREPIRTSLLALKGLTYAPTGGIVAAPTTSLPEALGGVRNWDYRFCWVRDAVLTLGAFMRCGHAEEALAFPDWLLRASSGRPRDLRIMYGIAGERRLPEQELDWLPGYERSSPVRVGNGAAEQLELDVYGELADAGHLARTAADKLGVSIDDAEPPVHWRRHLALWEAVESIWPRPDEGEVRGPATSSPTPRSWPGSPSTGRSGRWRSSAATARSIAGAASARDPCRGLPRGLRPRAWRLHPVLRIARARRQPASDPRGGLPAPDRRARPRHDRGGAA